MRAPRKAGRSMRPEDGGGGGSPEPRLRPKPRVCRRLFAEEDPLDQGLRDNMFNQLTEDINRRLDDACNKYNFDFRTEEPLEGDWAWERITTEGSSERLEPATTATGDGAKEAAPLAAPQAPPADPQEPPADPQAPTKDPAQPHTVPQ